MRNFVGEQGDRIYGWDRGVYRDYRGKQQWILHGCLDSYRRGFGDLDQGDACHCGYHPNHGHELHQHPQHVPWRGRVPIGAP